jgi:hypothetical protein
MTDKMNAKFAAFVQDAINHGCEQQEQNGPGFEYLTPCGLFPDARGRFIIQILNPNVQGNVTVFGYYMNPDGVQFNCGMFDARDGYANVLEQMHVASGTCNACGTYVGPDNMERYSFAGKACHDCVAAMREKYETTGWYD